MLLNVTEIGSPKVDNGVVSGFSSANYLKITDSFNVSSAKSWEMFYKITTGSNITTGQTICGHTGSSNYDPVAITTNTSKHFALTLCGSSSSSFLNAVSGKYTILPNTNYWLRLTFDGSKYVLSYSLNNVDFIDDVSLESTKKIWTSNLVLGRQQGSDSEYPFLGSIDLNECYIKINGELWWTGMVEGGIKPVRSYVLKHRKQKYYKNVEVEKTYKCFTISENSLYYYALEPLNLGDTIYSSTVLATSISEISKTAFTITTINSNGSIVFSNPSGMLNRNATPYASGDLIGVTNELVESTKDDYDVVENLGESYYTLIVSKTATKEVVEWKCFSSLEEDFWLYVKVPYTDEDNLYIDEETDGEALSTSSANLVDSQVGIRSIESDSSIIDTDGNTWIPYPDGDLKTTVTETILNTSYSLCREKK